MRSFNMLRACFWLLAALVGTELSVSLLAGFGCAWLILVDRVPSLNACPGLLERLRDIWAELLAAILALLLAGRTPPPKE